MENRSNNNIFNNCFYLIKEYTNSSAKNKITTEDDPNGDLGQLKELLISYVEKHFMEKKNFQVDISSAIAQLSLPAKNDYDMEAFIRRKTESLPSGKKNANWFLKSSRANTSIVNEDAPLNIAASGAPGTVSGNALEDDDSHSGVASVSSEAQMNEVFLENEDAMLLQDGQGSIPILDGLKIAPLSDSIKNANDDANIEENRQFKDFKLFENIDPESAKNKAIISNFDKKNNQIVDVKKPAHSENSNKKVAIPVLDNTDEDAGDIVSNDWQETIPASQRFSNKPSLINNGNESKKLYKKSQEIGKKFLDLQKATNNSYNSLSEKFDFIPADNLGKLKEELIARINELNELEPLDEHASASDLAIRDLRLAMLGASASLAKEYFRRITDPDNYYVSSEVTKSLLGTEGSLTPSILMNQSNALPRMSELKGTNDRKEIIRAREDSVVKAEIDIAIDEISANEEEIRGLLNTEIDSIYNKIKAKKKLVTDLEQEFALKESDTKEEYDKFMEFESDIFLDFKNNSFIQNYLKTSFEKIDSQKKDLAALGQRIEDIKNESDVTAPKLHYLIDKKELMNNDLDFITKTYEKLESEINKKIVNRK
jgi:hypothetical protein